MDRESGRLVRLVGAVLGLRSHIGRRCGGFRAGRGRRRLRLSGRIFQRRIHRHCGDEEGQLRFYEQNRVHLTAMSKPGELYHGVGAGSRILIGVVFLAEGAIGFLDLSI